MLARSGVGKGGKKWKALRKRIGGGGFDRIKGGLPSKRRKQNLSPLRKRGNESLATKNQKKKSWGERLRGLGERGEIETDGRGEGKKD